jgi:SAM-dependent methyltransferase
MDQYLYRQFFEIEEHFWWSVATRRVFFQLIRELERDGAGRALDVGCGTGIHLKEFPAGWQLVAGCDYSELALSFCSERGLRALLRCDATRLPFANQAFNLVTALDVIEHLDDDEGCVRELARVTRAGGHVLMHVPAFPALWTDKDELSHHRRRYQRSALASLAARCGLEVTRLFYINSLLFPLALLRATAQRLTRRRSANAPPPATAVDRLYRIPVALNRAMTALMELERRVIAHVPMPFGLSLVCLARKPV